MSIDFTEGEGRRLDAPLDALAASATGEVRPCGSCSLCCKVLRINALEKPAGEWCAHFRKGVGCSIHSRSPGECRNFQCFWTLSSVLGDEWRPDRSKLVLWSNVEGRVIVDVDPAFPNAWRREPYYSTLKAWSDRDRPMKLEVLVRSGGRLWVIFPEADLDLGPQQPDMSIDSGYRIEEGRRAPFAVYVEPRPA
jgi:hypothetical protein